MAKYACPHGVSTLRRNATSEHCSNCAEEWRAFRASLEEAVAQQQRADRQEPRDYSKFDGTVVSV